MTEHVAAPCYVCNKPIEREGGKYTCLWIHDPGGLRVAFAHDACASELEGLEDVTEEFEEVKRSIPLPDTSDGEKK